MITPSYVIKNCPFCLSPIKEAQDAVFCFDCKKPHHKNCWRYNLERCASFGCKGTKIDENYLKVATQQPKAQPVPISISNAPIVKPEVRQLKLKPLKNKSIKPTKIIQKPLVRIPDSFEKPEYKIPDYVFEPLIKPDFLNTDKKRNIRKAFPLPVIKYKKKETEVYEKIPLPEHIVPDYVNDNLQKPEETTLNETVYAPQTPMYLKLKIEKLQKKRDEAKKKKVEIPVATERYIPDYVNLKEIPRKKKRKKIPQYYKPLIMYPATPVEQKDYNNYIPVEKPEAYIPDYVYSDIEEHHLLKLELPENLVKSKQCVHCNTKFKVELILCPNCKKSQNINDYKYVNYLKPSILDKDIDIKSQVENKTIFVNALAIKSLALHKNGNLLSYGCKDNIVKIWDLSKNEVIEEFEGHKNYVNGVDFSPNGRFLASGSVDTTIRIWDLDKKECKKEITGNAMGFNHIKFSPDGDYIISSSGEGMVKVWEIYNGVCLRNLKADMSWVNFACFSPTMEFVASCDSDNMIRIWDIMEARHIKTLVGHFDAVNTMAYSPDGRYLASGSNDNTIKIWDMTGQEVIKNLTGHFDYVNSLDYSPNGQYIVSGSNDKTVKIWDVKTGKCIRNMQGHNMPVTSVIYGSNGSYVISASLDKTIKIWYLI